MMTLLYIYLFIAFIFFLMTIFSIAFLQALQRNPYMALFNLVFNSLIWPTTFFIILYTVYVSKKIENEMNKNKDVLE